MSGKRSDNYSREELSNPKKSPMTLALLRMKTVQGLLSEFVDCAIQDCADMVSAKPGLSSTSNALKDYKKACCSEHEQVGRPSPQQVLKAACDVIVGARRGLSDHVGPGRWLAASSRIGPRSARAARATRIASSSRLWCSIAAYTGVACPS
jgi:hypothetical protein